MFVLAGRRVDAGKMVAVENHGDWTVDLVELIEEIRSRLVGVIHTLCVSFDTGFLFFANIRRRIATAFELVVWIPVVIWKMILHGYHLQKYVSGPRGECILKR